MSPVRTRPFGAQLSVAYEYNAWINRGLEIEWNTLSDAEKKLWSYRDGRRSGKVRAALDQFRSVNLRRSLFDMPCLRTPPDKHLSPVSTLDIPLRPDQKTPPVTVKLYQEGVTMAGVPFTREEADFWPSYPCPKPKKPVYIIQSYAGPGGTIWREGYFHRYYNGHITFHITVDPCYWWVNLLDNGVAQPLATPYTITGIDKYHMVAVHFLIRHVTFTSSADEGAVIDPLGPQILDCGTNVFFSIEIDPLYTYLDCLLDGESIGTPSYYYDEDITEDHTIHVVAQLTAELPNTITASSGPGCNIGPEGEIEVPYGDDQAFGMWPDEGYGIDDVLIDDESIGPCGDYEFLNVTEDHTIHVLCAPLPCTGDVSTCPEFLYVKVYGWLCGPEPDAGWPLVFTRSTDYYMGPDASAIRCVDGVWRINVRGGMPDMCSGYWVAPSESLCPYIGAWDFVSATCGCDADDFGPLYVSLTP